MQSAAKWEMQSAEKDEGEGMQIVRGDKATTALQLGIPAARRQSIYHHAAQTTQSEV